MKILRIVIGYFWVVGLLAILAGPVPEAAGAGKTKLAIISSYHPDYLWEQDVQDGVCAGLAEFKFLLDPKDIARYRLRDAVDGPDTIIRHFWMDTKRKSRKADILAQTAKILPDLERFKPDLVILGDDNAARYVGTQLLDGPIPVVFYGMDVTPLKYGLVDSLERPGHNVTGIYQTFYFREALLTLQKLAPSVKTFAILSDNSETGRAKSKIIQALSEQGQFPMRLVRTVVTDSYAEWKSQALQAATLVDAFVVVNHNTLKEADGTPVDQLKAGAWYLRHVKKPECAGEKQFAQEGLLLVVDDSGYKQGYEAVKMASQILRERRDPAAMPPRAPERGKIIVNRKRAAALGIDLDGKDFIEETLNRSLALDRYVR